MQDVKKESWQLYQRSTETLCCACCIQGRKGCYLLAISTPLPQTKSARGNISWAAMSKRRKLQDGQDGTAKGRTLRLLQAAAESSRPAKSWLEAGDTSTRVVSADAARICDVSYASHMVKACAGYAQASLQGVVDVHR